MGILSSANIASALSQTIFGGTPYANTTRVPMLFTSTRRLRLADPGFKSISTFLSPTESSQKATANLEFAFNATNYTFTGGTGEFPVIEMAVNPNSISWKQPKRFTKRDTQEGSIFFHFTNSKGQNNDILTMDFRGNTGNINLVSSMLTGSNKQAGDTGAAKKSLIWHNLWSLTREPILLNDNTINEFMVIYSSIIIPEEIMLVGFFSSVLEWTDSADKPFSKDYSMSFTVQQVVPPLEDLMTTISNVVFNPDEAGNLI